MRKTAHIKANHDRLLVVAHGIGLTYPRISSWLFGGWISGSTVGEAFKPFKHEELPDDTPEDLVVVCLKDGRFVIPEEGDTCVGVLAEQEAAAVLMAWTSDPDDGGI